jgi:chromosomal replication initiator protein
MPGESVAHDPAALWQAALRDLASQVSRANYDTWLDGTEGVRLIDDTLVVGTRSEFVTEWLQKRLRPSIIRSLSELGGRSMDVAFEPLRPDLDQAPALAGAEDVHRSATPRPRLRERYTFDRFIVGKGNELAAAAARGAADSPGDRYNPLFLYGAAGLGKTHLLQAVGHMLVDRSLHVLYVSAESFTNQLITAIQGRKMEEFRDQYRLAGALLIDDIQFIAGKEQTQEEFFHTFNELYESGHQIVITSDKSPALIPHLEERLRTRFEWGMIADLQAPDMETRVAILRSKAREQGALVPDAVLNVIAARFKKNIRELEGSLTRVLAYSRLTREPLTPELVQSALSSLEPTEPRLPPSPGLIVETVCRYFDIDQDSLLSKSREKRVAYPRQIAMYLMRELAHRSLVEIGDALGGRDHSTVHHGWRKMERSLAIDPETQRDIGSLREMIEQARRIA